MEFTVVDTHENQIHQIDATINIWCWIRSHSSVSRFFLNLHFLLFTCLDFYIFTSEMRTKRITDLYTINVWSSIKNNLIWSNETWFEITLVNLMRTRHTLFKWISQLQLLLTWKLFAELSSNNEKTRHDVHSYTKVELDNDTIEALFIFRYLQMCTQI